MENFVGWDNKNRVRFILEEVRKLKEGKQCLFV